VKKQTILGTAAVIMFGVGYLVYSLKATPDLIRVVPYTAVEKITDARTGRSAILQRMVRSDGSVVEKIEKPMTIIWNVPDKTETVIDPVSRYYVTSPIVQRRISRFLYREAACERFFSEGNPLNSVTCSATTQKAFGHSIIRATVRHSYTDGSSSSRVMSAIQDLAWLSVRDDQYDKSGTLATVTEVIDLHEGEPVAEEFAIPQGYAGARDFVEYTKATKAARKQEVTQDEVDRMTSKWKSVIDEAIAGGDNRFK
jgi:hypothetical protein